MLHTQTVAADTLALIKQLMADPRLNDFVLVGGTALALMLGHRQSIDIDLFSANSFDAATIAKLLQADYKAENVQTLQNQVSCLVDGVKLDLIAHRYPAVKSHSVIEGIRISSLEDIAAMKLNAIVGSGSRKKDFVDVYFLLEKMPLSKIYDAYERKYPNASRAIARLALTDTSMVNEAEQIDLIKRRDQWKEMKVRIQNALEFTNKIYQSPKQSKRKNNGLRP